MAEPPRRTLLAKLRGKKCKKGASTGGRDAAVGGGEGKEKVCRARDTRARRAAVVPVPELECMSDPVRGKQDYFNGGLEKRVVHVVGGEAAAVQDAFPRYGSGVHVNTHRGDARTGGGARDGAAEREDPPGVCVHGEDPPGVCVHGETPDGRSDRGEMKRVQERDGHFTRPGSRGDHRERRAQLVPFPRRHTGGDSIGFGTRESVPSEHRAADTGVVHLTDGQEPLEEIGTNVGYETDVGRRYRDKALHVHRAGSFIPTPDVETLDPTKLNYTGDGPAETRTCDPESPHVLHYVRNVDENELIRTIESSFQVCRDVRTPTLQSPTFFPTELEMVSTDVSPCLATRHHSVDSEDDDYYDNEILPFYESGPHNTQPTNRKEPDETSSWQPASAQIVPSGSDANAEETDRLRSRLREAFCLLMNAMQDGRDGQDGQDVSSSCADNSVSSSRSHDSASVCSWSSSTWPAEGDVQEGSGRGYRGVGGTSRRTRSLQCLVPEGRPPLQRSVSDGGVRYPAESDGRGSLTEKESGHALQVVSMDTRDATSGGGRSFEDVGGAAGAKVAVPRHVEEEEEEETRQHGPPTCPGVPARSPAPPCVPQPSQSACGGVGKPPGLTVNKMQEWMHRGRVLSSEMRLRIAGSSPRGGQGPGAEGQVWAARPAHVCTQGAKPGSTGPAGAAQPVGVADGSSVTCRDSSSRLAALNSITVSKKRNWLHQSSARPGPPPEDAPPLRTAEDERGPPPSSNTLTPSAPPEAPPPQGVRQLRPSALPVDPADENDADDEGEIWYNPIPEEEEAAPPPHVPAPWPTPPGTGPQEDGRGVPGAGGDAVSGNVVQMCRAQDENLPVQPAAAEASEQSATGPSPPSSPNPVKKSSSVSWSLPERIRSPHTVRKLSMKMKRLPELGRKLSVKGNSASVSAGQSESRARPARVDGAAVPASAPPTAPPRLSPGTTGSGNVICRYHLDSSVSTQPHKRKGAVAGVPKSASKGGYLSDGDSPELVAKSSKHGALRGDGEAGPGARVAGTDLDVNAFQPYSFSERPRCTAYLSGLMSVHLCGAEGLKPARVDSRDVYCAIQVDSVNKARTALLTCSSAFLDMDHNFNIELENAQHLKLAVFSWEATPQRRNRVCCHGTVALPPLFWPAGTGSRGRRLAVRLEPRGVIYVRLGLMERWANSLDAPAGDGGRPARVFGIDAERVVEREGAGLAVPLLIEKCIDEIERRGCQVVGLYRLCGSAAVKKELREAFERDSHAVELSETNYPDINVITGVLKDYLRELPSPLISKPLYEAVLDTMSKRPLVIGCGSCENSPADSDHAVSLLDPLPDVNKVTLRKLLDHLKRVASHHEVNKMTCQNLAVCFGPVLLRQRQDAAGLGNRVFVDSEELASALHFKKHIEVLHYLLQLWPVVDTQSKPSCPVPEARADPPSAAPVRRRKERPQVLNLNDGDLAGVLRPRPGRLDSPSNRYAGDWSGCREAYLPPSRPNEADHVPTDEADYDDVPTEETRADEPSAAAQQEGATEGVVCQGEDGVSGLEALTVNDDPVDTAEDLDMEEEPEVVLKVEEEPEVELKVEEEEPESGGEQSEEDGGVLVLQQQVVAPTVPACFDQIQAERDEHAYQAYMKIHDISPVLSHRGNLRDLQESIDTLIGNLERELNKNKLSVGYGLSH